MRNVRYNKGSALFLLNRYEEALLSFQKFIEYAQPQHASQVKKAGEAIHWINGMINKALEVNPQDTETWNSKGLALDPSDKHPEAIVCYDKALEMNPKYVEAWYNKGNTLRKLGRYQEAIACYDKALEINPKHFSAWNNKGNALIILGKHQEAILSFQKYIEFAPPQDASRVKNAEENIRQLKEMV